jgi:hypothetical protein
MSIKEQVRNMINKLNNDNRKLKMEKEFIKKYGNYWYSSDIDAYIKVGVYEYRCIDDVNTCGIREFNLDPKKMVYFMTEINPYKKPLTIAQYHKKYCRYDKKNKRWILK